jgi:hypothetical protein
MSDREHAKIVGRIRGKASGEVLVREVYVRLEQTESRLGLLYPIVD